MAGYLGFFYYKVNGLIIKRSAENMNNVKSKNYKLTPNETEKKYLENQRFRTEFNFERIKISKKNSDRLDRYDRKFYSRKKKTT